METRRPTVLITVETRSHVREARLALLNFLSQTLPNLYPHPEARPQFIFEPHDPAEEEGTSSLSGVAHSCVQRAQRLLAGRNVDMCLYTAVGAATEKSMGPQEYGVGVIAIVDSIGVLRLAVVGPFIGSLDTDRGAALIKEVEEVAGKRTFRELVTHANPLGVATEWLVDAMIDKTAIRH